MSDKVTQHTQEPWFFEKEFVAHYDIKHDHGTNQIEVIGSTITKHNARRIVACVNACAGIDTDVLEQIGTFVQSNVDALNIINKFKEAK